MRFLRYCYRLGNSIFMRVDDHDTLTKYFLKFIFYLSKKVFIFLPEIENKC